MRRGRAAGAAALAVGLVLAGCRGSTTASRRDPVDERALTPAAGGGTDAELTRAAGAAAPLVQQRLTRLGAPAGTTVKAEGLALRLSGPVDRILREAAGRRTPTELRAVASTTVGACPAGGAGVPSLPVGRRCYTLGERVAGVEAVQTARAELQPGVGWSVVVTVQSGAPYTALRTALAGARASPVAVVADGAVVAALDVNAVLGLKVRIGPGMSEREARRLAAALLVADTLPAAYAGTRPDAEAEPGPFADKDFWLAALSAHVCGAWLGDAPTTPDASGIHSHGDGFVYAHPASDAEAGANATVGRWLSHGSWTATATALSLWDGRPRRNGDACPDGRPGTVRWWVDGAEQTGDPEKHRIGNGEAITLSFDPAGTEPGPPPAAARLPLPRLAPEA